MRITKETLIIFTLTVISLMIMFIGGASNMTVTNSNEGRMPFLADYNHHSDTHFSYQNGSTVKYLYLTDRFFLLNQYWSIGDFLLISGFLMFVAICIFVGINYYKTKNDKDYY